MIKNGARNALTWVAGVTGMAMAAAAGASQSSMAASVQYVDVAAGGAAGVTYRRTRSPRDALLQAIKDSGFFAFPADANAMPLKSRGAPGTAVFDYDNDGDLDIYVTNGPGSANSLYSNQLRETGQTSFVDVAISAGVGLSDDDSTGVCYGDIDNDSDQDLLVLNLGGQNRLLENRGDGTFMDITAASGIGGGDSYSTSCSMGDIDSDGLLDIAISNTYTDWRDNLPINSFEAAYRNEHNQLLRNMGGNRFMDVSEEAGIRTYRGISWAIALVDYDLDGDVDLFVADDQGGKPSAKRGGFDTGYVRIYNNDGSGHFTDLTEVSGTNRAGAWMGLAFGDFNADGVLDFFASNIGDYVARFMTPMVPFEVVPGDWLSGWFLGDPDGVFAFQDVGALKATPFGWGNAAVDYDNDGDTDIVYHGGIDFGAFTEASNAGAILRNDGSAHFDRDSAALASDPTDHARRLVQGVAAGDLNDDGFPDIVSVSSQNWPAFAPLMPMLPPDALFGGPFDDASIWPTFRPVDPANPFAGFLWNGVDPEDGTLAIDLSSGNDNNWVKVRLKGSAGILPGAHANRDAIGAVMRFRPKGGKPVMMPVLGGASYASQHSLEVTLGLGKRHRGVLEVTWPGGVRNRLYGVKAFDRLVVPEIPCSFDAPAQEFHEYRHCVKSSVAMLVDKGMLDKKQARRFVASAIRAFRERDHDDMHDGGHGRRHGKRHDGEAREHHREARRHDAGQSRPGGRHARD